MELKNYDYTNGPYYSSKKYDIHPLSKNGFNQYIGNESYMHQYLNNHFTANKIEKLNKELDGKFNINHDITNNPKYPIDNIANDNLITISNNKNNLNNYNYNCREEGKNEDLNNNDNNKKIRPKTSNIYSQKNRNMNLNNINDFNSNNNNFNTTNSKINSIKGNNNTLNNNNNKKSFANSNNNFNTFCSKVKFLKKKNNERNINLDFNPFKTDNSNNNLFKRYNKTNKNFSGLSTNTSKSTKKIGFDLNNIPRLLKENNNTNNDNNSPNDKDSKLNNPTNQFTKRLIQSCKGRRPNNFEIQNKNFNADLMQKIKTENQRLKEIYLSDKKRVSKKENFPKVTFIADQPHLIIKDLGYGEENKLLKGKIETSSNLSVPNKNAFILRK